ITDIDRSSNIRRRLHESEECVNQIIDITEGAGLRAVAIDGDVTAKQRLYNEIRDHPPVVRVHTRAISIEDPSDLDLQLMLPPIVKKQCFCTALSFIITRARPNRVNVPPIILDLRMDTRIAVNFGCGCLEDSCPQTFSKAQHIDSPVDTCLRRLHRIALIVDRRSWASEIVNLVDLHIKRKRDIMPDHLKMFVIEQMLDVASCAGEKIVDADDDRSAR